MVLVILGYRHGPKISGGGNVTLVYLEKKIKKHIALQATL
jgi:hypothetical protein